MSQAVSVPAPPIGAAPDWRAALLPPAKRRFWVFSDLQQSDPDNARRCMETGVRDFLHVSDLARGHVCACDYAREHTGCEIINLGTGTG